MSAGELYAKSIARSAHMTANFVSDFTEEEMFIRPVPGANHATWQLGHVAAGTRKMCRMIGIDINLADDFAQRFTKDAAKIDDPKAFPAKQELLATYNDVFAQVQAAVAKLTEADLAKTTGFDFAPTVADVVTILTLHPMMHGGQFSVIRRKLAKPNLM